MVLKRPQKAETPKTSCSDSDLQLMEHLVKKSLDVNPGLRAGRSTQEVLQNLRTEAVKKPAAQEEAATKPKASVSEKRRKTMEFFLEQKAEEYHESANHIVLRMKALEHELTGIRETTVDELIDFLSLISGGTDSPEAREVLRTHRELLKELGVTENDILQAAASRR